MRNLVMRVTLHGLIQNSLEVHCSLVGTFYTSALGEMETWKYVISHQADKNLMWCCEL